MSDIVERLEDANGELLMVGNDFSDPLLDAAKEIKSLRKRVKELDIAWHKENDDVCRLEVELKQLEEFNLIHKDENKLLRDELAALKQSQGEPVAWMYVADGFSTAWSKERIPKENLFGKPVEIPLCLCANPTIPEGWQLVPVEPTDEMFIAGDKFMECTSSLGEAWEAMLAAAPRPEDVK